MENSEPKPSNTLFALFCGINKYENPKDNLNGCLNDVKNMKAYLEDYCKANNFTFKPSCLLNEKATYDGIIKGFDLYKEAKDKDICVFYFSGHGSVCTAPEIFRSLEPDREIETLVCHDGRPRTSDLAFDLTNKELSWLIWKATRGKDIIFTTIVDACHSGRITRTSPSDDDKNFIPGRNRTLKGRPLARQSKKLKGFEDYIYLGNNQYAPPQGRNILLAAARDKEKALEGSMDGEDGGLFTFILINRLKEYGTTISYEKLMDGVASGVNYFNKKQTPQILAKYNIDLELPFLGVEGKEPKARGLQKNGTTEVNNEFFMLRWDEAEEIWYINSGSLGGKIPVSPLPQFDLMGSDKTFQAQKVEFDKTIIGPIKGLNISSKHRVVLKLQRHNDPLKIGISKDSNEDQVEALVHLDHRRPSPHFILKEEETGDYIIKADKGQWKLESSKDKSQPFPLVDNEEERNGLRTFMRRLDKLCNWQRNRNLDYSTSNFNKSLVEIVLSMEDGEEIDLSSPKQHFQYEGKAGNWEVPKLKLLIKNKGEEPIYASILHFKADYAINNDLLDMQEIPPDREAKAFYSSESDKSKTDVISLKIHDRLLQAGYRRVEEQIKIIVSNQEFTTNSLNQKGIFEKVKRSLNIGDGSLTRSWASWDIVYTLNYPDGA